MTVPKISFNCSRKTNSSVRSVIINATIRHVRSNSTLGTDYHHESYNVNLCLRFKSVRVIASTQARLGVEMVSMSFCQHVSFN